MELLKNKQNFKQIKPGVFVTDMMIWKEGKKTEVGILKDNNEKNPLVGKNLYRYLPYSTLYASLKSSCFSFSSPLEWMDPYEGLFFEYLNIKLKPINRVLGCKCFTYNCFRGEESAWIVYKREEPIVKISLDLDAFIDELSVIAAAEHVSFYFTLCDYTRNKSDIDQMFQDYKKKKPVSLNVFLNLMSIKRKAFSNECEVRLFAVNNTSKDVNPNFGFSNYKSVISEVYLPPLRGYHVLDERTKYYESIQKAFNSGMEKELNDILDCKIMQSRLYQCP